MGSIVKGGQSLRYTLKVVSPDIVIDGQSLRYHPQDLPGWTVSPDIVTFWCTA